MKKTDPTRKGRKAFVFLLLWAVLLSAVFLPANRIRADFGDFAGNSDYGSSSDDSWGSSWSGGLSFDFDSDGNSSVVVSSSSTDMGPADYMILIGVLVVIIAIAVIVVYFSRKMRKGRSGSGSVFENMFNRATGNLPSGAQPVTAAELQPMSSYTELDPGFDLPAFREHLSNLYMQMENCWHEKDIEPLKPYFTDAFYNQSERQVEEKRRNHQTPCTEQIAVLEVTPRGYYQSSGLDHIVVKIRTRLIAYILDDETGQVISGDRRREKFMEYEWDLCRKTGTITGRTDGMRTVNCPNCGAPLTINQTARCPYCNSVVTIVNEDWALDNIKGISQRTS